MPRTAGEDLARMIAGGMTATVVGIGPPVRVEAEPAKRPKSPEPWQSFDMPAGAVLVPLPPSVNGMYVNVPGRGRVPSKAYTTWKRAAVPVLKRMPRPESFPVEVRYVILPGNGWRWSADVGNREKALTDAVVAAGVLPDDNTKYVGGVRGAVSPGRWPDVTRVAVWSVPFVPWW